MDKFQQALQFRHASKKFDGRRISQENVNYILEAGRLAPSSFGLEPWKFLVIQKDENKEALLPLCFHQKQITTCSHIILILGRLDLYPESTYIIKSLDRFGNNAKTMEKIIVPFLEGMDDFNLKSWIHRQCFLAAQNMMMAAAFKGIDSCPMEGFLADKMHKNLELDNNVFIALVLPFGYRTEDPKRSKMRWELTELVNTIK